MRTILADLHIHSLLSPCGDLEMTPKTIVAKAVERGLSLLAISDHNSTLMGKIVADYAKPFGITVLPSVEINSAEEVHCLAILPDWNMAELFQGYIDKQLVVVKNKPSLFGYQVVVDADENILHTEERLLIASLSASLQSIGEMVHQLGGLFVPAHIYRRQNGILHQLGFIPPSTCFDAFEITPSCYREDYKCGITDGEKSSWIFSSDAHYPDAIGKFSTRLFIQEPSFSELKMALMGEGGRSVEGLQIQNL